MMYAIISPAHAVALAAAFYELADRLSDEITPDADDITAGFCAPVSVAAVAVDVFAALGLPVPPAFVEVVGACSEIEQQHAA